MNWSEKCEGPGGVIDGCIMHWVHTNKCQSSLASRVPIMVVLLGLN